MDPKMTQQDAAVLSNRTITEVQQLLNDKLLTYKRNSTSLYFGHKTAKQLFNFDISPRSIAFQIVKGGTGKTSLACAFAVRANLYGLRVLCIDLDQQGNLTHTFGVDAEQLPVMIDILADGYPYKQAITEVYPGLDLIASRIENSMLDEAIKVSEQPLEHIYQKNFNKLKSNYDVIVIDCPPNLGQSVAAVALGVDMVVSPVVPEHFALSGLKFSYNAISELQDTYQKSIPFGVVLNKYDSRTNLSEETLSLLSEHLDYQKHLLKSTVNTSQEFPNAIARGETIYDVIKPTQAKKDIDALTSELLGINQEVKKADKPRQRISLDKIFSW